MTKEEYLVIAAARYDSIKALETKDNFYDFQKEFDRLWVEYGRDVVQKAIGDGPADRRKKKHPDVLRIGRTGQQSWVSSWLEPLSPEPVPAGADGLRRSS